MQASFASHALPSLRLALLASGLILLAGCGGSTNEEFSGDLFVQSCSLACTDGAGGLQVNCGVVNVAENLELSVLFSQPIAASTIGPSTLQVTDVANGTSPDGLRFVDPLNPRRVIFRPAIQFESGGVSFSFLRNRSYEIRMPGVRQGDAGPFIMSTEGDNNVSRLVCTVFTSEGIADIVPGNPRVKVFVDVAIAFDPNGNPIETVRTQMGHSVTSAITNVARTSKVYFEFNELMNIPTVANVVTGESLTIFVEFDQDGDIATAGSDRIPIPGSFEVTVDQLALTTFATFTPDGEIWSAGADPLNPRLLIVRVTTSVADIANFPVTSATGGGVLVAIPETLIFSSVVLPDPDGEGFDRPDGTVDATEDANVSGAGWGPDRLSIGLSGGSGRHGALRIEAGETVVLNTDSQSFPMSPLSQIDVLDNGGGSTYPLSLTVTDGVFELSSLFIAPLGKLVLRGSNPARLLVRGRCTIAAGGLLDVSGESGNPHDSTTPKNIGVATPPAGGPNGAAGGLGGDRADIQVVNMQAVGAISNPGAVRAGQDGGGVGGTMIGAGLGGIQYPDELPDSSVVTVGATGSVGDTGYNIGPDPLDITVATRCMIQQMGGTGSGGGYAFNGTDGTSIPTVDPVTQNPAGVPISPGPTTGGDASMLNIEPSNATNAGYTTRLLRWQANDLRGGSSGGGGGNHPFATHDSAMGVTNPNDPVSCIGDFFNQVVIERWLDHSGASGGAGGGAVEVLAGRELELDGRVSAAGGAGGNALATAGQNGSFAMPGGGGSAGSIRLRSSFISIGPGASVDVRGGSGGNAPWTANMMATVSRGGLGSAGLFRIEDGNPDLATQISFASIQSITLPINPGDPSESLGWLSVAPNYVDTLTVDLQRPDTLSGSSSCWIKPEGNFLQLLFREDTGVTLAEQGWAMDVVLDDGMGGTILRPYRGRTAMNPTDWVTTYGNVIGYGLANQADASPIVVRFQGGRTSTAALTDPCNTNTQNFDEVRPGSLTPWVSHPADLQVVLDGLGNVFRPNMIRYCIIFDRTDDGINDRPGVILTSQQVLGVDNLMIIADPD